MKRRTRIFLRGLGVGFLSLFLGAMISTERFVALGAAPDDATLARMKASPHFENGELVNWGTFNLAYHAWSEPAETLFTEAPKKDVALLTPHIGESIEPTESPKTEPWWRPLPPMAPHCP